MLLLVLLTKCFDGKSVVDVMVMTKGHPWSMDELVVHLKGRYSARPHPMNVGKALRAL